MRVSRYAFADVALDGVARSAGDLVGAANAQETSKPEDTRAPGGAAAESKSAPGRVPRDILVVNPCKAAHPPSYCNVRN